MIQLETAIDNFDREIFESILEEHHLDLIDQKKLGETAVSITTRLNDPEEIFWLGRIFQSRLNDRYDINF